WHRCHFLRFVYCTQGLLRCHHSRQVRPLQAHQGRAAGADRIGHPPLRGRHRPQLHREHERRQDLRLLLLSANRPPALVRLRDEGRRRRVHKAGSARGGSEAAAPERPLLRCGRPVREQGPFRRAHVGHGVRAFMGPGAVDSDVQDPGERHGGTVG
ncbi:Galactosyltransferase, partial [Musa troglodytarum]